METLINASTKFGNKITKLCALFFLFTVTFSSKVYAQADIKNISKTIDEAKKQAAHEEFMSYVYMTVGFGIVIAVAWFSTSMAKKQRMKSDAEKSERASKMMSHGHHAQGAHRRR
jgi:TRAP-type C4-dicarboxylate transport system permease small subunit